MNKPFNSRKFKYGMGATVFTIVFIAIVIAVNLVAEIALEKYPIKMDVSANQLSELSDVSVSLAKNIDKEVKIYHFVSDDTPKYPEVENLLDRYVLTNAKISIEEINLNRNPNFLSDIVKDRSILQSASYLLVCGNKYKALSQYDLMSQTQDQQGNTETFLTAEQNVTSALAYVTSERDIKIAFTTGHQEAAEVKNLIQPLYEDENYTCSNINLLTEEIPDDISTLIINAPKADFSDSEIAKLDRFANQGKNIIYYYDIQMYDLPLLNSYLNEWGIIINKDIVIETADNMFTNLSGIGQVYIPLIKAHDITKNLTGSNFLVLTSSSIDIKETQNITNTILFETSSSAYAKDVTSNEMTQSEGDRKGPLALSALFTKNVNEKQSRFLVSTVGAIAFANQFKANFDYTINTINFLNDKKESITIPPKSLNSETLSMSQTQYNLLALLVIIFIPVIILIIGLVVFLRRRKS